MSNKEYLLAKLERNGINLVASGHNADELNDKLKDSLRLWLISNDMFSGNNASNDPAYFLNKAQKILEDSRVEEKLKIFNLSAMGDVFEGSRKISELVTHKNTSDAMRFWLFHWQSAKSSEGAGGVLGAIPAVDELRWLVTDSGYYITVQSPTNIPPKTIEEKIKFINEFISHFEVAFKFGAPSKTLSVIAEIIKKAISNFNETQGNYNHLSVEELEVMLTRRLGVEMANKAMGTNFMVRGLSVEELKNIISSRKSQGANDAILSNEFSLSDILKSYINELKVDN